MTARASSWNPSLCRALRLRLVALACAVAACCACAATNAMTIDDANFWHYGIDQGLPQSQVRVIHQDAAGYLWVGTQGGLGRYNGREFARFSSADGLAGNQIDAIATDSGGRLWVGTNVGLCGFRNESFECVDTRELRGRHIQALAVAPEELWVGTDRGLVRMRSPDSTVVETLLPKESIRALAFGKQDMLFVGTDSGLKRLDPVSGTVQAVGLAAGPDPTVVSLLPAGEDVWLGTSAGLFLCQGDGSVREMNPDAGLLRQTHVSGMVRGPAGGLILATYRGLYRVDPEDDSGNGVRRISGLEDEIVRSIFRDREGVIWIGQDSGMRKLAPTHFLGYDEGDGLLANFVRAMAQDSAGRLWLGTRVGVQVVPVDADGLVLEESFTLTRADGLPNDRIYAIEFAPEGGVLLATNSGVVHWREQQGVVAHHTEADGLPANHARALRRDSHGRIWVGTVSGVAVLEDGELTTEVPSGLDGIYPFAIREDSAGALWFATRDHGLLRLDPDGAVTRLTERNGLSDQTLWDLAEAREGGMWVGSNGDGLFRVDSRGDVTAHMTRRDGLANDFVWSVLVDDDGRVWAYTTRGLSRYDGEGFVSYDKSDGLLHLEGGATGALQTRDGRLWFASVGGLVRFDPDDSPAKGMPPPISIEDVAVDGASVAPGARLPPDHAEITFEFAALTFQNEEATRYRYRLAGLQSDWNVMEDYRPVTFARLGRGDYEFQVQGANAAGVWSTEPARFAFGVAAPLWLQPWFIALSVLGLAALIAFAWRYRVRGLSRHAAELEELVGERTRELEQLNRRLLRFANTDPLTGLRNRRFLMDQVGHDIAQCLRRRRLQPAPADAAIGFLLIDLDGFKQINDGHGHQAGDAVLEQIARVLLDVARQSDYVVRWGGDEFLIVARQIDPDAGCQLAQRVVEALRDREFSIADSGLTLKCRCSLGLCSFPFTRGDPEAVGWEEVVEIADAAAYLAKREGGDRWVEIVESGEVPIDDKADYLREIRVNAEALEAKGWIRIRHGSADAE